MARTLNPTSTPTPRTGRRASELEELKARLAEAEETLAAIRRGEVDAVVVSGTAGDQVFTLHGAERPYRLLMEAMNEGALTVSQEGTILYCNKRFSEMVRTPLPQVVGISLETFVEKDQQPALRELLAGLPGAGAKAEFSLGPAVAEGSRVPAQLSLRPLEVDGTSAVSVVATDLSERKGYEQMLRDKNEELERRVEERTADLLNANASLQVAQHQLKRDAHTLEEQVAARTADLQESMRSLEQFCYTLAHDLRAPLRAVQGFTHILLEECKPQFNAVALDYADRIIKAASRMDELLRDLLAYGRLTSADLPLAPIDLNEAVARAVENVRAAAQGEPSIDIRPPLPQVHAHPLVLAQVIENLLNNALKFVAPDVTPRIQVAAEQRGDWVRVSVRDNGIGIKPEFRERVFGVFERLSPEQYPGTGIGLAIVQKGVERMGGKVGVESQPGKGSCFWIELRKAQAQSPETRHHQTG